jgi:hypothetical protein
MFALSDVRYVQNWTARLPFLFSFVAGGVCGLLQSAQVLH